MIISLHGNKIGKLSIKLKSLSCEDDIYSTYLDVYSVFHHVKLFVFVDMYEYLSFVHFYNLIRIHIYYLIYLF